MLVALGSGAVGAAMLYLFAHAFFKALLFLGCGSVIHATEKQEVDKLGGLGTRCRSRRRRSSSARWRWPVSSRCRASGRRTRSSSASTWHFNERRAHLVLITLPITALYMMRVFMLTFLGKPKDEHVHEHAHESPPSMTLPLILLAVLAVVSGFVVFEGVGEALGFDSGLLGFVYNLADEPEEFHFDWRIAILSVVLVGAGLAGGRWIWGGDGEPAAARARSRRSYRLFRNRFYIDELYQWVINNVVLGRDASSPCSTATSSTTPASTAPARRPVRGLARQVSSRPASCRTTRWRSSSASS